MVVVYIRSRRRAMSESGHPCLTCLPNGEIFGNAFGAGGQLQQWDMQSGTEGNMSFVTLQSTTGRYLSSSPDGTVDATSRNIRNSEKWFLRNCDDGCVSLMSYYGKYLVNDCRFDCGKVVRADRDQLIDWAKWIIVDDAKAMTCKTPAGKVAIAGVYTAALFMPLIGAVGVVTVAKRSMVYGGSDNPFSMIMANVDRPGELTKVPVKFKTNSISKKTQAAAGAVKSASSRALGSFSSGTMSESNHSALSPEEEEEQRKLMSMRNSQLMGYSQ